MTNYNYMLRSHQTGFGNWNLLFPFSQMSWTKVTCSLRSRYWAYCTRMAISRTLNPTQYPSPYTSAPLPFTITLLHCVLMLVYGRAAFHWDLHTRLADPWMSLGWSQRHLSCLSPFHSLCCFWPPPTPYLTYFLPPFWSAGSWEWGLTWRALSGCSMLLISCQ